MSMSPNCARRSTEAPDWGQISIFHRIGCLVDRPNRKSRSAPSIMSGVAQLLPISPWIPEILARVRERRAAVITAAPGTGKTTRVPPALVEDGPVILLQPRRVAARSIAARISAEQGWTPGREVGWHVRFEQKFV